MHLLRPAVRTGGFGPAESCAANVLERRRASPLDFAQGLDRLERPASVAVCDGRPRDGGAGSDGCLQGHHTWSADVGKVGVAGTVHRAADASGSPAHPSEPRRSCPDRNLAGSGDCQRSILVHRSPRSPSELSGRAMPASIPVSHCAQGPASAPERRESEVAPPYGTRHPRDVRASFDSHRRTPGPSVPMSIPRRRSGRAAHRRTMPDCGMHRGSAAAPPATLTLNRE